MTQPVPPLLHRAHKALIRNPHLAGKNLLLENQSDRIVLRGNVDSFYEKQMAQETIRNIDSKIPIDNQIVVRTRPNPS